MEEADQKAIERVLGGETEAYGELVSRYQRRLRSALSYYCTSDDDVEEFVQDAFVRGYVNLRQFDRSRDFFPWLRTIAMNALRSEVRRRKSERANAEEYLRQTQMAGVEDDAAGEWSEARAAALQRCLEGLSPAERQLVALRYEKRASVAEVAKRLDCSVGALKVRLSRLRDRLGTCVEKRTRETAPTSGGGR